MEKIKRYFTVPRNVFWLGLTSLFNDMSNEMIMSVMPAFFISVLKANAQALGVVEGVADGVANFIKIYSGRLSDRVHKRKIFAVIGYSFSVMTRPFYLLAGTVGGVIGIRLTDRLGKGLRDAPRDVLVSMSTPPGEEGRSFGFHRGMDTLGAITGPLVAYFILLRWPGNFNAVFITAFVAGLVALFSLFLVKEVTGAVRTYHQAQIKGIGLPRSYKAYLISIFIFSTASLPLAVLLFRTKEIGFAISTIPLFYAVYSLSSALLSLPAGTLADKLGPKRVITGGYILLIIGYAALALSQSPWSLVCAFLLLGLFAALTDGVQRSFVSRLVSPEAKGTAFGFLNGTVGFGSLLAGVIGGYLWQNIGGVATLALSALVITLGLIFFIFFVSDKESVVV
jgi:MFS family permease